MSLPFSLNDLLHQRTVESARIEYKKGWNPAAIMRTLCAFANDFENLGGGYVIIGQDCDADEHVKPRNVGLLFFSDEPKRFIKGSQIDVVIFPDDLGGDEIVEKIFDGPLHRQITLTLQYIQDAVIIEKVFKRDYKPQADRMFNYPLPVP